MINFKFFILSFVLIFISSRCAFTSTIPFRAIGKLIIVKATVGNQTGNFIVDTGIPNVILNSQFFKGKKSEKVLHGMNGNIQDLTICYASIQIGDYKLNNVYAEVIPLLKLEKSLGVPIHGFLGTSVFRKHLLFIDFQNQKLEMYPIDKNKENSQLISDEPPIEILPFKIKGGTPLVSFFIDDLEFKVTVDTGAEINLFENKHLNRLSPYFLQRRKVRIGGFGKSTLNSTMGKISGLKTNAIKLDEMNTAFTDLSHFNRNVAGPDADGIVGQEFLSQFRVAFDFKNREIYLWESKKELVADKK